MEKWQRQYVTKHLSSLIKNTTWNQHLSNDILSSQILHYADIVDIESKSNQTEACTQLFRIIQTRINGFVILAKVLYRCGQSKSFNILREGLAVHGVAETQISISGEVMTLKEILKETKDVMDIEIAVKSMLTEEAYLDIFLAHNEQKLVVDTIPPDIPYYVPRFLSKPLKLDDKIFKVESSDIFVFKGVSREQLRKLVEPHDTAESSTQLKSLSSRFIVLKSDVDWKEICEAANEPVHLIRQDTNKHGLILEATTNATDILRQHLKEMTAEEKVSITEEEFIRINQNDQTSNGVCISDTPGMGKSRLLISLARRATTGFNTIVAFISLAAFMDRITDTLTFESINSNSTWKAILNHISPNLLTRQILLKLLSKNVIKFALFMDGFDEVKENQLEFTKKFLQCINAEFNNVKIYVTARPNMRTMLEGILNVISYNILPFTKTNQITFLVSYWTHLWPYHSHAKLHSFAEMCIHNIQSTLSDSQREIMGIPIQCYMLAHLHQRDARIYSDRDRSYSLPINFGFGSSIYEIYQQFIDEKFTHQSTSGENDQNYLSISMVTHRLLNVVNRLYNNYTMYIDPRCFKFTVLPQTGNNFELQSIKEFHVWKALQLLFPNIAEKYASVINLVDRTAASKHFRFGLLETKLGQNGEDVVFVHLTFAEYLCAEFFVEILTANHADRKYSDEFKEEVIHHFINEVLHCYQSDMYCISLKLYQHSKDWHRYLYSYNFKYTVIVYFINERIKVTTYIGSALMKPICLIPPKHYFKLLFCAIRMNLRNIFNLLTNFLLHIPNEQLENFRSYFIQSFSIKSADPVSRCCILLCMASNYSKHVMIRDIVGLFDNFLLIDFRKNIPNWLFTPLHWASIKGDFELARYLTDKITLKDRNLVYYCIHNTYYDSSDIVEEKLGILKDIILPREKSVIYEKSWCHGREAYQGPLVTADVNLKLVKFLVESGSDVEATYERWNIVHRAFVYFQLPDFDELCHFLIVDKKIYKPFEENDLKWECPLHYCLLCLKELTIKTVETILRVPSIHINHISIKDDHNNVFLSASLGTKDATILQTLIDVGADFKAFNIKNQNALHLAIAIPTPRDVDIVRFLISRGVNVNHKDDTGKTPLDVARQTMKVNSRMAGTMKPVVEILQEAVRQSHQ